MAKGFRYLVLFALCLISTSLWAYRIEVKIHDLPDHVVRLGRHSGPDVFILDTTKTDAGGMAVFEGKGKLEHGIYFILLESSAYVDILIDEDQDFSVSTHAYHMLDSLKQKGSFQNQAFIDFQKTMADFNRRGKQLEVEKKYYARTNQDSLKAVKNRISAISTQRSHYYDSLSRMFDGVLLGDIVKALIPVKPPPEIKALENTQPDAYLRWVKEHFFDNINFSEPGVFNTPDYIVHQKLHQFCQYFLDSRPDSVDQIKADINRLMNKASASETAHRYVASFLVDYYNEPDAIGMEWILVFMADEWFNSDKLPWVSQAAAERITYKADRLRRNLVNQKAAFFRLPDADGNMHEQVAPGADYTILWFWDPECDVCMEKSKQLVELYPDLQKDNIEVIAVYDGQNRNAMQYAAERYDLFPITVWNPHLEYDLDKNYGLYKIPRLYIVDSDTVIKAKDIKPTRLLKTIEYLDTGSPRIHQEFLFDSPRMKLEEEE